MTVWVWSGRPKKDKIIKLNSRCTITCIHVYTHLTQIITLFNHLTLLPQHITMLLKSFTNIRMLFSVRKLHIYMFLYQNMKTFRPLMFNQLLYLGGWNTFLRPLEAKMVRYSDTSWVTGTPSMQSLEREPHKCEIF